MTKKQNKAVSVFSLFILLMSLTSCDYLRLRSVNKDLENKNCESARDKLLKGLKQNPDSMAYQYNLIFVSLCEENAGRALKQMDYVLSMEGEGAETSYSQESYSFATLFLKAYVLGEMGDVDEALAAYQEALVYRPTDIKVKQNMELLLQSNSGKSKKKKKGGKDSDSASANEEQEKGDKQADKIDQSEKDEKKLQEESQQKKPLSEKQIEQIMKEIDGDEKKVRSQGIEIKKSKGQKSEKNW
ncbi:MAG: hypothetical protein M9899_10565 [Bdellovibrionaceae bacterium]|nr:hypothetical protein [Pseudobdellovibrionaceae bacterium]